jgi:hypothetical protein
MFDCKIVFSGLCGFVFDKDLKTAKDRSIPTDQQPTRATVLMPNLLVSRVVERPGMAAEQIDAHFPQLVFNLDNLDAKASTVQPDLVNQANGTSKAVVMLYEQSVKLNTGPKQPAAAGLSVVNPPLNGSPTPPINSLWWIASVADAFPGGGGLIDPGLLQQTPYANGPIIARLDLSEGELSTEDLSPETCKFAEGGDQNFDRKIAVKLALLIRNVDRGVTFELQRGGDPVKKLVLRANPGQTLAVEIKNNEIDAFVGMPADLVYVPKKYEAEFEVYYEMSDGFLPQGKMPILQQNPGLQTVHGGLCPPGAFVAPGAAGRSRG